MRLGNVQTSLAFHSAFTIFVSELKTCFKIPYLRLEGCGSEVGGMEKVYLRGESNPNQENRNLSFYPLNYGGLGAANV